MLRALAILAGAIAFVVTAVAWLQTPHGMTADEAVQAAARALRSVGLADVVVEPHPTATDYSSSEGGSPIAVWKTVAEVGDGTVELWLARSDGQSVFLDDRTPDGHAQLLTDDQFGELARGFPNPAAERQVHRNLVITVAAALLAMVAVTLARDPVALASSARPVRRLDQETT